MPPVREQFGRELKRVVGRVYAKGYGSGVTEAADTFGERDAIPDAADRMPDKLKAALKGTTKEARQFLKGLEERIAKKRDNLRARGWRGQRLRSALRNYSDKQVRAFSTRLVDEAYMAGRLDGANAIAKEGAGEYQWTFPHQMDGGHGAIECPICEGIRMGSPYTKSEAEGQGFPALPHPNCDHAWIMESAEPIAVEEGEPDPVFSAEDEA